MAFRFENLDIWKNAIDFSGKVYKTTEKFPKEEIFSLSDQLKRAAVSISANIAEGSGSDSNKDFRNYLNIAIKSLFEVISLLAVALKNRYISNKDYEDLYNEGELLVKKIQAFRNTLK